MSSWYRAPATEAEASEQGFVVVECMLGASRATHPLPAWKECVLNRLTVLVSVAEARTLSLIKENLHIVMMNTESPTETRELAWPWEPPKDGVWKLASARLTMELNHDQAARVRDLLRQEEKPYGYTNSYRFISLAETPNERGRFIAVAELAHGVMVDGARGKRYQSSLINATAGLQQLIGGYLKPRVLEALPKRLQQGVCQEVAQQVTSCLGNLCSSKVRGTVTFPTTEDRDPVRRAVARDRAIDVLVRDVRMLERTPARELEPAKYAADDPRGDRMLISDERWFAAIRSPDPHPLPLFFVQGGDVIIQHGKVQFDAGFSKRERHRGGRTPDECVRADRPQAVRERGFTSAHAYYALLPVLDTEDAEITAAIADRDAGRAGGAKGRHAHFGFETVPLIGRARPAAKMQYLRVPLSFDRARFEQILNRTNFEVAWSKVIRRDERWFLQLTLRVPFVVPTRPQPVLGVTFGIDAIATWALADAFGKLRETGQLTPNAQIAEFIKSKHDLEWDQVKARWVGQTGRQFADRLETIAHGVSNQLVALAREHGAVLAIHDVDFVQKSSRDSGANRLFTAWNYGQLRRQLGYKSELAGCGTPVYVSDFLVKFACPRCGACRSKHDPKDAPVTWRENGTLHCRNCTRVAPVSPVEQAVSVVTHGLPLWQRFWARQKAKQEE